MREALELLGHERADRRAVLARVVGIEGFSTRPGDDLVAIDASGAMHGSLLGGLGASVLSEAAVSLLASGSGAPKELTVDVHDKEAVSAGLACGGRAHVLIQPASQIPEQLWRLLSDRAPAALLTPLDGTAGSTVVDRSGTCWGAPVDPQLLADVVAVLGAGRTDRRRLTHAATEILLEVWVPDPRVIVVGSGELVQAISSQASLLGWETQVVAGAGEELAGALQWAGATGALVVLSHDPHVDVPALRAGLAAGVAYVGALGSRSTQSRRVERLVASGVAQADVDRIHRPVGLDLGGHRAPEVALAIVAEILASHRGRDARPLSQRSGPIH